MLVVLFRTNFPNTGVDEHHGETRLTQTVRILLQCPGSDALPRGDARAPAVERARSALKLEPALGARLFYHFLHLVAHGQTSR